MKFNTLQLDDVKMIGDKVVNDWTMAHEPFMDESWEAAKRGLSSLIQPPGTLEGQTFVVRWIWKTKRCSLEILFFSAEQVTAKSLSAFSK